MNLPDIASLAEAAAAHGVKPATVRKWLQRGKLTHHGYDEAGRALIDADELGKLVNPPLAGKSVILGAFGSNEEQPLLDVHDAAALLGVKPVTIWSWYTRGYISPDGTRNRLRVAGFNEHGRRMYRLIDVAEAERATRDRAGRQAPRPPMSASDEIL